MIESIAEIKCQRHLTFTWRNKYSTSFNRLGFIDLLASSEIAQITFELQTTNNDNRSPTVVNASADKRYV